MNLRFLYNMAVVHEFVKEIQSFFALFKERRDGDGEFITVDVMAMQMDENKPPKKICELIVTREDLMNALKRVSPDK